MSNVPSDLKFTKEHEWVATTPSENVFRVGITDYAQSALGDIVYVQLPKVGQKLTAGEVSSVNGNLDGAPEIINSEPYGSGWILEISVSGELPALLSGEEYEKLTA